MKVSNRTRNNIRAVFANYDLPSTTSDKELDAYVRELRKAVGASSDDSLQQEAALAQQVLTPFRDCLLDEAEKQGLDSEQWGNILYDIFLAATSGTKSEAKLQRLVNSEDAWADMVTLLLTEEPTEVSFHGPWWSHRVSLASWCLILGVLCFLVLRFEISGRTKFYCLVGGTMLLGLAGL